MIVFTVIPKNSGLKKYESLIDISKSKEILAVRGEDVPFFVEELIKQGKKAIGITGQDLYKEYTLNNYKTKTKILKILDWEDPQALFKKPTLCLLGPESKNLDNIPKKIRIGISDKYKLIAKKYLNFLETKGFTFEKFYLKGSVESALTLGFSDLVIDIVYTGKSMKELNLKVYDKLFYSNFVVIGGKSK